MAETTQTNAYLRTKVLSAPPEQLRLLLLDGALKFCRQADAALGTNDFEKSFEGFNQAREIVIELVKTINSDADPELAERVRGLYLFMYKELAQASIRRDREGLAKIIELLEYERETWVMLLEQITNENASASKQPAADEKSPAPTVVTPRAPQVGGYGKPGGHTPISIQA
ncbi:MAG: flagellar export chaperone FliS [Planctomycetota bacterium]